MNYALLSKLLLEVSLSAALLAATPAFAAASQFFTYDPSKLALAKQKLVDHDPLYAESFKALLTQADAALTRARYSVMDKTLSPASGDKHDFFSFGPYWWPDPKKPNGLPYIQKDGQHNPDASTDSTDSLRLGKFSRDVKVLALAWYFTGEKKYAVKVADLARAWFVTPATRMNPNLNYGQAIPGRVDGRGIGIIGSRDFIPVMDSLALILPTEVLSESETKIIHDWYRDYLNWLLTSRNGFEESNAHNNHGTFYSAQVVAFALYTGQLAIAKRELEIASIRRLNGQIDREGKLIAELERTRPSSYMNFALEAFGHLGRYGELLGMPFWDSGIDGRSIKKALLFVAQYVNGEPWPYKEIDAKEATPDAINQRAFQTMLTATRAYPDEPIFAEKARWLLKQYPGQLGALILPLK